jgi:hypothetical protein
MYINIQVKLIDKCIDRHKLQKTETLGHSCRNHWDTKTETLGQQNGQHWDTFCASPKFQFHLR